ncbi:MAG: site-specific integrase [Burkholderiales bacterium]|nr:site-specific integrase [Burkholderiales bacterium]
METTDFAHWIGRFFTVYLIDERSCSHLTVDSYRVAIIMYLDYMEESRDIKPEKMELKNFTKESVEGFLDWLQKEKEASISTRNQKLAAIKSFARYLQEKVPDYMEEYQKILSIPTEKAPAHEISYLKPEGVKLLISQIDLRKRNGLRDLLIMSLLYTVGLRVSELTEIRVGDLQLSYPPSMKVHGKGDKTRQVPIAPEVLPRLREYLKRMKYDLAIDASEPLFKNHHKEQFTRRGIAYLVTKYADMARKINPAIIPADMSPHKLRHTAAMEMLGSGVDLMQIKDILGHASLTSTEVYAKADPKFKSKAVEMASKKQFLPEAVSEAEGNWNLNEWLKSLGK